MTTCTPLRGQHISVYPEPDSSARLTGEQVRYTSCFPFNRRHDHVREHQNFAILMAEPQCSKVGAAAAPYKATDNASDLANFLSEHPSVIRTIYPGLDSHPQHEIAVKQQLNPKGEVVFGSMLSIDVGDIGRRDEFLNKIEIFQLAESLGSVESLVCVPFFMTHAALPEKTKLEMGLTETLIRLSVGIEDFDDLKLDLSNALNN